MTDRDPTAWRARRARPVSLCVHAHFYQPPRENPWTEEVQREPSAAPFHDWNSRIAAECYRPNAFARIVDADGRVLAVVNNYERVSFNVGPTLMSWLERHEPGVYARIVDAQRAGGGAIAQAWNHMILPLASERDMRTQIRWGLADFRHRFGTEAPGMWLPETAVDEAVLAVLAEEGVGFTILAPYQAAAVRRLSGTASRGPAAVPNRAWEQVDRCPDTRVPYRWLHPSGDGRGLDIVFYDGPLSHDLAFSTLPSETIVDRAVAAGGKRGGLVTAALDGETFGHHQKWMDRGLAYALVTEAARRGVEVTNLAAWLRRERPVYEVRVRRSAWSCAHGVGRWATDCGCATGGPPGSDQRWRAPLRAALDCLRDFGTEVLERRRDLYTDSDPWAARDAYVDVLIGATTPEDFAARHIAGDRITAFTLLEAQRNAMLMYTSCGWFFHDLAGLETVQVLRYAARTLDLLAEAGEEPPEDAFLDLLAQARSFDRGDGRRVWQRQVLPARVDAPRVAAHLVLADLFGLAGPPAVLGGFDVEPLGAGSASRPGSALLGLAWRRVRLVQRRTGRAEELVAVAVRSGDLEAAGVVRPSTWPADAMAMDALRRAMEAGVADRDLAARMERAFDPPGVGAEARRFDLAALLPEAAEALLERAAGSLTDHLGDAAEPFLAAAYWALLAESGDIDAARGAGLPDALRAPAEAAVARRLEQYLAAGKVTSALELSAMARRVGLAVDRAAGPGPVVAVERLVLDAVQRAVAEPGESAADEALAALRLAADLGVEPDVTEAQELVYDAVTPGDRPDLQPLAEMLRLSPSLFAPNSTS